MPEESTADAGSNEDASNAGGAEGSPPEEGKAAEDGKTFTQADIDKIVSDRLAREAGKFNEKLAEHDKFKASHAELEKLRLANSSELDKAVAAARAEGISEVTTKVNTRLVKSEARVIAAGANFHNPADAVGLVDLSAVKVSDDGEVDTDAISKLITELAAERPYLIKAVVDTKPRTPKADPSQGARGGGDSTTAQQFASALGPLLSP